MKHIDRPHGTGNDLDVLNADMAPLSKGIVNGLNALNISRTFAFLALLTAALPIAAWGLSGITLAVIGFISFFISISLTMVFGTAPVLKRSANRISESIGQKNNSRPLTIERSGDNQTVKTTYDDGTVAIVGIDDRNSSLIFRKCYRYSLYAPNPDQAEASAWETAYKSAQQIDEPPRKKIA